MQIQINKVKTLLEALPYIKIFNKKIIVIKYGGSAQSNTEVQNSFTKDIALLRLVGICPVVVHGGGKQITEMLNKLNIETKFINGQRITSKESMEVVEMVLSGNINKNITSMLNNHGVKSIGISGKDSGFIKAESATKDKDNYTGSITSIDAKIINSLLDDGFVPVIAPIGCSNKEGHIGFNINADLVASKLSVALKAEKVIFMTDTSGVLNKDKKLLPTLTEKEISILKKEGVITSGMIPKVESCLYSVLNGVPKAHIIDGRVEHSILLELLTNTGIGTVVKPIKTS